MFKFFSSIANIISTVVRFIQSSIDTIVAVFNVIGKTIGLAFKYIGALPTIVTGVAIIFISYCIIVNLINKGS